MGTRTRRTATPEQILAPHPPAIRALANRLRRLVRDTLPEVEERGVPGWGAINYHHPAVGLVCGIFPFRDMVKLVLEHGASLPDPDGILTGATRQVRHVEVRSASDVRARPIRLLLLVAVHEGPRRRAQVRRQIAPRRDGGRTVRQPRPG